MRRETKLTKERFGKKALFKTVLDFRLSLKSPTRHGRLRAVQASMGTSCQNKK